MVMPGSSLVRRAAEAEGLDRIFLDAGFEWCQSGCSMCLAMNDDVLAAGERCASSTNRNFEGRQGVGGRTHLMSPAMVAAAAISGRLTDARRYAGEPEAMRAFTMVTGVAAALPAANINTDVIMPKQFLKGIDRSGLGEGAFHDLRFDSAGRPRDDFVLNQAPWRKACFLVVGPNFGTGSSREHAVWGLMQLGIRAIIGTSFAGIFFDNCANNGLLAITIGDADVMRLSKFASNPASNVLTVDLRQQSIGAFDETINAFDIEPSRKEALLLGLDVIGQTLKYRDMIEAFERQHLTENPWLA